MKYFSYNSVKLAESKNPHSEYKIIMYVKSGNFRPIGNPVHPHDVEMFYFLDNSINVTHVQFGSNDIIPMYHYQYVYTQDS